MLKLTMLVRRAPQLSHMEFDHHWRTTHAALVREHAEVLHIRRYIQTAPLENAGLQEALRAGRGALPADYDGCAELWWDSLEDHRAARETPEGLAALQALIADEKQFVDLTRSHLWYGTEREIVPLR
ncbi:EthD domain-containing protein [Kordiimonas marina]|uniref:EthD domain-containing protein n=1 Tax=Kordiimonas marina TaxID=2872312 RepID=UPI001FF33FF7|nr:EthD domain-containing protein [Kordiimonas marina]MCJ9430087.1 EthD domain-containing protein [Kordiimonas marina]